MLVLSRKLGESVVIGTDVELKIVEVKGNRVRIAISAPEDCRILRSELLAQGPVPAHDGARERTFEIELPAGSELISHS